MTSRRITSYYCDFCRKGINSKHWMTVHERYCTRNPNRGCRLCARAGWEPTRPDKFKHLMPDIEDYAQDADPDGRWRKSYQNYEKDMAEILAQIQKEVDCPACVLAILRQSGVPLWAWNYDFKSALAKFWEEQNNLRADDVRELV